jgi:small-conductance mechanosensitive channel
MILEWLNQHNINVVLVIGTTAILIVASFIILVLSRLLRQWLTYLQGRLYLSHEATLIINRVFITVLWTLTASIILNTWGVALSGIWAFLVSAITIIGVGFLATWAMISNFTANLFLIFWRPFEFGQTVEILPENLKGRVTDRNLMFTTLREESGSALIIPNNFFFQKMFRVGDTSTTATVEPTAPR